MAHLPRQRWQPHHEADAPNLDAIVQATGLSPLVAQVLINRGIQTPEAAAHFLQPESLDLPSPLTEFADLPLSLELLARAIDAQAPIAICGDYDADGMTSTALLLRALRGLGAQVDYAIPSRMMEGYGINDRIVKEFHQEGVRLILTVDNGIAAHQPIALARSLDIDVIITDHHDLPPELPCATAILNPKLLSESSPYRGLAGVGVAYVLAVCLAQHLHHAQDFVNAALELFTLGTIADLAPLVGVNRRWVKRGLARLPHSKVPGIQALIRVAGLEQAENGSFFSAQSSQKTLKPDDIGFKLGPRINAIGRIGDPQVVIDLLTTEDLELAYELAQTCEDANQSRRQLCEEIEAEAIELCEQQRPHLEAEKVLLVVRSGWHHGVIGIVASRLVERYGVPVFIATPEDDDRIRGSARSIPEFNVFEALEYCKDCLERHGGHRAAGGFSVTMENLGVFRQRLIEFANRTLTPQHLKPLITLDGEATFQDLNWDLYHQIDSLHPWGIANPEPIFWIGNLRVLDQGKMGSEDQHLRLSLAPPGERRGFRAVFWHGGHYHPVPSPLEVAFRLKPNTWRGETTLQLQVVGLRSSSAHFSATPISPPESSPSRSPKAHFTHNDRAYECQWIWTGKAWELRIRNDAQVVLVVSPGSTTGLLGSDRSSAKPVDLSAPSFAIVVEKAEKALGDKGQWFGQF